MGWGEEHTPAPSRGDREAFIPSTASILPDGLRGCGRNPEKPDDAAEKALRRIHSVAQGALSQGGVMSVEDAAVHYADALRVLVAIAERNGGA